MNWQKIETAPKLAGVRVLLYAPTREFRKVCIGVWSRFDLWHDNFEIIEPTHWAPLTPPTDT